MLTSRAATLAVLFCVVLVGVAAVVVVAVVLLVLITIGLGFSSGLGSGFVVFRVFPPSGDTGVCLVNVELIGYK